MLTQYDTFHIFPSQTLACEFSHTVGVNPRYVCNTGLLGWG